MHSTDENQREGLIFGLAKPAPPAIALKSLTKIILALPPSADSMPLIRQKAGDGRET
jgi:hypothetical protein